VEATMMTKQLAHVVCALCWTLAATACAVSTEAEEDVDVALQMQGLDDADPFNCRGNPDGCVAGGGGMTGSEAFRLSELGEGGRTRRDAERLRDYNYSEAKEAFGTALSASWECTHTPSACVLVEQETRWAHILNARARLLENEVVRKGGKYTNHMLE
jgi:hypothetical protein